MNILFVGNGDTGKQCLEYLVNMGTNVVGVASKDSPKSYASSKNIPIVSSKSEMISVNPDTILSVYYHKRIPKEVLNMCDTRINFHSGKLPEYRGCNINMWLLLNKESTGTITAHTMEEDFDSGDIIREKKYGILARDTGYNVYERASLTTVQLFKEIIPDMLTGNITTVKQKGVPRYYNKELPNNGVIDWSKSSEEIDTFVRALNFPGKPSALTTVDGKPFYVDKGYSQDGKYFITKGRFK